MAARSGWVAYSRCNLGIVSMARAGADNRRNDGTVAVVRATRVRGRQ